MADAAEARAACSSPTSYGVGAHGRGDRRSGGGGRYGRSGSGSSSGALGGRSGGGLYDRYAHAHNSEKLPAVLFDDHLLCFGEALILQTDALLRGTSKACKSYGLTEPLSKRADFVIKDFEVWKFTA